MKKAIKNTNAVIFKLELALIGATNHKLEVTNKEKWKREEIMKKRKIEIMVVKHQRARRGINLSSKKKKNYKSDTENKTNLDQANDKYSL